MIMNGTLLGNYQERKSFTSAIAAIVSDCRLKSINSERWDLQDLWVEVY